MDVGSIFTCAVTNLPDYCLIILLALVRRSRAAPRIKRTPLTPPLYHCLSCALQDASASAVAATAKGCVWNQDVPALARAAGLRLVSVSRYTGGTIAMIQAVKDA